MNSDVTVGFDKDPNLYSCRILSNSVLFLLSLSPHHRLKYNLMKFLIIGP